MSCLLLLLLRFHLRAFRSAGSSRLILSFWVVKSCLHVVKVAEMQLELERLMAENANLKTDVRRPSGDVNSAKQLTGQCVDCAPVLPFMFRFASPSSLLIPSLALPSR